MENLSLLMKLHILNIKLKKIFEKKFNLNNYTYFQKITLFYIIKNEGKEIYQKDIEQKFNISKSTVSESLNFLESQGYIIRNVSNKDSRLKEIKLTDKSKKFKNSFDKSLKSIEKIILNNFTNDQKIIFNKIIDEAIKNINQGEEKNENT